MGMINPAPLRVAVLDYKGNRHTLADVKDIFVWTSVWGSLALQAVAVQVEDKGEKVTGTRINTLVKNPIVSIC
jgi:hypothetical protein